MTIWRNPTPIKPLKIKAGKKITPEMLAGESEDSQQMALFAWAADSMGKYPDLKWLHSIPNGGSRNIVSAAKMVATGARGGVWDLFLPCPIQTDWATQYAGCYIEMKKQIYRKRKNGGLSDDQLDFGAYVVDKGYYCKVCYTWEEARDTLINYLEGKVYP